MRTAYRFLPPTCEFSIFQDHLFFVMPQRFSTPILLSATLKIEAGICLQPIHLFLGWPSSYDNAPRWGGKVGDTNLADSRARRLQVTTITTRPQYSTTICPGAPTAAHNIELYVHLTRGVLGRPSSCESVASGIGQAAHEFIFLPSRLTGKSHVSLTPVKYEGTRTRTREFTHW